MIYDDGYATYESCMCAAMCCLLTKMTNTTLLALANELGENDFDGFWKYISKTNQTSKVIVNSIVVYQVNPMFQFSEKTFEHCVEVCYII